MKTSTPEPVLTVKGLCFGWPDVPLFQQLDLVLLPGVSVVWGAESCGKTTLLRLLSGELRPERGSIRLGGNQGGRSGEADAAPSCSNTQVFRTDPRTASLDAISARAWWASLLPHCPSFDTRLAAELAQGFSLMPHLDKPLYMLSAGSKRKVWLCAAFAAGTPLTLIDEPFAALDMASIGFLGSLLEEASRHTHRAWLVADHALPEGLATRTHLELRTPV